MANEGGKPAKRVTGLLGNASGNPAHLSISSSALQQMWKYLHSKKKFGFSFSDSVFVDFGCGTGLAVLSAMTQPFKQVVGVELNSKTADIARKNVTKFHTQASGTLPVLCSDAHVECKDMADFDFETVGCDPEQSTDPDAQQHPDIKPLIVLYMYEPLWTIAKPDARVIYERILSKAVATDRRLIVMYFFAGNYCGDALPVLEQLDFTLRHKEKYASLFFGAPEDLYVYTRF